VFQAPTLMPWASVQAHARLPLLNHELHETGQHELARALELFLGQHGQLVEELARLRALDLEAIGKM